MEPRLVSIITKLLNPRLQRKLEVKNFNKDRLRLKKKDNPPQDNHVGKDGIKVALKDFKIDPDDEDEDDVLKAHSKPGGDPVFKFKKNGLNMREFLYFFFKKLVERTS